MIKKFN
jgi:hypothetical protein